MSATAGSVPAAYAVVAGGCDWPLPPAVGISINDVSSVTSLTLRWMETPLYIDRLTSSDATILVFGIRYDIDTILPKYRDIDIL